jgi:hypothetical protein
VEIVLTGDGRRFLSVSAGQWLWRLPDSEAPDVSRCLISTPKVMITLSLNTSGLHVRNLCAGESFNADCFVKNIMDRIHRLPIVSIAHKQQKGFGLQMVNAPIHYSKVTRAKLSQMPVYFAPHPHYSPDRPPSDFFLFGYAKEKMFGREFESADALLDWLRQEFEGIRPDVLERVFESWITRVEKCIEYEEPTSLKPKELRVPFLPKVSGIADANLLLDTLFI